MRYEWKNKNFDCLCFDCLCFDCLCFECFSLAHSLSLPLPGEICKRCARTYSRKVGRRTSLLLRHLFFFLSLFFPMHCLSHTHKRTHTHSLSLFVFHSNKLDHFANICPNVTEKALFTSLGRRSRNLKTPFPSSLTLTLVRARTHPRKLGSECFTLTPSLPCVCVRTNLGGRQTFREIRFSNSILRPKAGEYYPIN